MPRRMHARSRAGCLTCRQRHVRCDELRPSCQQCLASNRPCNYPLMVIPLRDRRMLQRNALPPGQQAPWALMNSTPGLTGRKVVGSTAMDPFDTLPVKMPFKSRELYHYFYQTGAAFGVAPSDPKDDCIALSTLDEHALRSTILIAGIHYSWNAGNLHAYKSAFLFHKVESIRIINSWLEAFDSKTFVVCVRQILTICLAEACHGNLVAAETHLNGIMALFDSYEQGNGTVWGIIDDIDNELACHYLLLTSCFVLALKNRLENFILFRTAEGIESNNHDDLSPDGALQLMKAWHGMEYGGLDTRLRAIRMFPYFFSPPPTNVRPQMVVDALPIIDCLRATTGSIDQIRANPATEHMHRVWNDGGPTKLLLVLVTSHVSSLVAKDDNAKTKTMGYPEKKENVFRTSWSGITAAVELYMHSVLNILNAGEPLECRLLYRILLIIKRDIDQTRGDLSGDHGGLYQALWFWKVFIGTVALASSQHRCTAASNMVTATPRKCSCSSQADLNGHYRWFRDCARAWSVVTGRMGWKNVKPVLETITWPTVLSQDGKDYAANIWAQVFI
ncbi:hypothetical protein BJX63DRAFT_380349 [Aspergillus granulosus]|uniref:Zn(2)-C6 fungal-type domain-containing protein n=1 Tax=Aspergillus granulosus TaxID=176169 RepID=A0ABR4HY21_9EURO